MNQYSWILLLPTAKKERVTNAIMLIYLYTLLLATGCVYCGLFGKERKLRETQNI